MKGKQGPTPQVEADAKRLLDFLRKTPATFEQIRFHFAWTRHQAERRLGVARRYVGVSAESIIPRPTGARSWIYAVVDRTNANYTHGIARDGFVTTLEDHLARMRTMARDGEIGIAVLPPHTAAWHKAKVCAFHGRVATEQVEMLEAQQLNLLSV